jgi:hypothetical protein
MDLVFEWLDPKSWEPPSSFRETFLIVALAGLLVFMFLTVKHPLWYALIFLLYALFDFYGISQARAEGRDAIKACKDRCDEATDDAEIVSVYRRGISLLEEHYFHRLHIPIRVARLLLLLAAVASAYGAGTVEGGALWWLSYLLLTAGFAVVEIPLLVLRSTRDRALRPLAAKLNEFDHARQTVAPSS